MKFIGFFLFMLIGQEGFTQDIAIHANPAKDSDYFDYEDYDSDDEPVGNLVFLKGCSWYCGGSVNTINSSSQLSDSGNVSYSAKNVHDFDKNTAWVEGSKDFGIGEYLEFTFSFDQLPKYNGKLGINKLLVANGYKKNRKLWQENSRVKKFQVFLNDDKFSTIDLIDSFEIQTVAIPLIKFPANKSTRLRFVILEVYEGTKYKDTAISLLMFDGIGVH